MSFPSDYELSILLPTAESNIEISALTAYDSSLYISDAQTGDIYVIGPTCGVMTLLTTIPATPNSLGINADGTILFTTDYNNQQGGNLFTINTGTGEYIQYTPSGSPGSISNLLVFGNMLIVSNTELYVANNMYNVPSGSTTIQILYITLDNINHTFTAVNYSADLILALNQAASGLTQALATDNTPYYCTAVSYNLSGDSTIYYVPVGSPGSTLTAMPINAGSSGFNVNEANFIDVAYVPLSSSPASGYLYITDNGGNGTSGNSEIWQTTITSGSPAQLNIISGFNTDYDPPNAILPFALAFSQTGGSGTLRFYFGNYGQNPGHSEIDKLYVINQGVACGGDPHCVCLDNSRLDVYQPGFYRFLDDGNLTVNCEVVHCGNDRFGSFAFYLNHQWTLIKFGDHQITKDVIDCGTAIRGADGGGSTASGTHLECEIGGYRWIFDLTYRSIALIRPVRKGTQQLGGLLSGQIMTVDSLTDLKDSTKVNIMSPPKYQFNALLAGSTDPHIITLTGQKLKLSGYQRLLQWENGYLNAHLNPDCLLLEFYVNDHGNVITSLDQEIWNLQISDSVLLRFQKNQSISLAVKDIVNLTGAFIGEPLTLTSLTDDRIFDLPNHRVKIAKKELDPSKNLYEQIVDPWLIAV